MSNSKMPLWGWAALPFAFLLAIPVGLWQGIKQLFTKKRGNETP